MTTNAQAALIAAATYCAHADDNMIDVPTMAARWADWLDADDQERSRFSASLVGWLLLQTDRDDVVGRLARQVGGDRLEGLLPRSVMAPDALRAYLLYQEFDADDEVVHAVEVAATEHGAVTR